MDGLLFFFQASAFSGTSSCRLSLGVILKAASGLHACVLLSESSSSGGLLRRRCHQLAGPDSTCEAKLARHVAVDVLVALVTGHDVGLMPNTDVFVFTLFPHDLVEGQPRWMVCSRRVTGKSHELLFGLPIRNYHSRMAEQNARKSVRLEVHHTKARRFPKLLQHCRHPRHCSEELTPTGREDREGAVEGRANEEHNELTAASLRHLCHESALLHGPNARPRGNYGLAKPSATQQSAT
mmetsp:Transcript_61497/g.179750  ORF Transcript_61497/g.179750 Transcript_61497/m.179750 type:complete len:238 (+) Transcript_61497:159-872(+)